MAFFHGTQGSVLVDDIEEAKRFYKETFGFTDVFHHGMDMLEFNGALFFHMFEVSAERAEEYRDFMLKNSDKPIIYGALELDAEEDVRRVFESVSRDAKVKEPIGTRPWSPCCAEMVDKYGVSWYITAPEAAPAEGCVMCYPQGGQPPEIPCDPCLRWAEPGYRCPKVGI